MTNNACFELTIWLQILKDINQVIKRHKWKTLGKQVLFLGLNEVRSSLMCLYWLLEIDGIRFARTKRYWIHDQRWCCKLSCKRRWRYCVKIGHTSGHWQWRWPSVEMLSNIAIVGPWTTAEVCVALFTRWLILTKWSCERVITVGRPERCLPATDPVCRWCCASLVMVVRGHTNYLLYCYHNNYHIELLYCVHNEYISCQCLHTQRRYGPWYVLICYFH